ncbi:MAG TPA: D-glycero-beta-D-manno-heptose 1,7-bisphosphate 7-phosphatase [Paenibacillus sp.]|uniref:D-glycero-beta-D-manno-heptose 1,7-bisphosphate 7-phosphatase n=1 Tax=Paenibacillus sp. TaxID=58172 RepID=UPI002C727EA8|nr:D-glycero-beta-D-manno-heptose 1,7-bisphosphate 7-phosphatase [Paenibacillus sp.]HUC92003.1 D-glycero-beta-D-manno-heptose 1,7-bisphosphate 7-phosphatase [Paenibacillus sp.]
MPSNKAVFLDRDGTINAEKNYLFRTDDWEWTPGAIEAIRGFNDLGYLVIVISNQAGIARGLYSEADLHKLHGYVDELLASHGARIDAYYYCPHHPDFGELRQCDCRKPNPGLLLRAQSDFGIDMAKSYMIGDKKSDITAGHRAGSRSILVRTGYGMTEERTVAKEVPVVGDLWEAYSTILVKEVSERS